MIGRAAASAPPRVTIDGDRTGPFTMCSTGIAAGIGKLIGRMCYISGVFSIRPELASDVAAVHAVNAAAFKRTTEADLVDRLRQHASPVISLVAEADAAICGHILFTPATLIGHPHVSIMALAPLAVAPDQQRRGIGSALVRSGLAACAERRCSAVVVLGHPAYYPRFGFEPASRFGLSCEYDVPDDVFMAMELLAGALAGRRGTIRYHQIFPHI